MSSSNCKTGHAQIISEGTVTEITCSNICGRGMRTIDRFHSHGKQLCEFIATKESAKELNSHRTGLGHYHGRRHIVSEHQHGGYDVRLRLYKDLDVNQ